MERPQRPPKTMLVEPRHALDPSRNSAGTPTVSVVIPAYNAAAHLAATLRSVSMQTVVPHEVIVVDDGSSDDTIAVANAFGVRVIALTHRGVSAVRNAGTQAASGEYIAYLDADDLWAPQKLAVQLAALADMPGAGFSFTDYRDFDANGICVERSGLRYHPAFVRAAGHPRGRRNIVVCAGNGRPVLPDMYFLPSSTLVRRADVVAIGGFDESLRRCEDYEFFLRLFRIAPAVAIMEPLVLYRRHAQQISRQTVAMSEGLWEIERRVAADEKRYPVADAHYIAGKGYLIHHRLGIALARSGDFTGAIECFEQSLRKRRTVAAAAALLAAHVCCSAPGRAVFDAVRAQRRQRANRRDAGVVRM